MASPALVGIPTAPTANPGTNTTQIATTAFVTGAITTAVNAIDLTPFATKLSPTFTGTPQAPTPPAGDNSYLLATTNFVQSTIASTPNSLWLGSAKFINSGLPSSNVGANGDFWFQV